MPTRLWPLILPIGRPREQRSRETISGEPPAGDVRETLLTNSRTKVLVLLLGPGDSSATQVSRWDGLLLLIRVAPVGCWQVFAWSHPCNLASATSRENGREAALCGQEMTDPRVKQGHRKEHT